MNKERATKMALHAVLASVLFVQATLEAHVDWRYVVLGVLGIAVKDVLAYLSTSPTAPEALTPSPSPETSGEGSKNRTD